MYGKAISEARSRFIHIYLHCPRDGNTAAVLIQSSMTDDYTPIPQLFQRDRVEVDFN